MNQMQEVGCFIEEEVKTLIYLATMAKQKDLVVKLKQWGKHWNKKK